ncbi:LPS O-antigen chain length determinant protein, WzzB/FepE family [Marinobacter sp. DSM 26671]|uniref:Wzz/FepE/Etk N-terminal domain-containing protein n=1 Tax=Marinobacter sp. DSM 26671 TaxID=1761793 RepID=UPI0008F00A99|nr:Wzz/FepE/Etk N-terminal domain-containing protein [Marinobacter sp. DSM 26671]SFE23890.1 LPS O-antigen chain length determinant protein, WzzB/FepE family [Marinobacter sp. DSM 26671]
MAERVEPRYYPEEEIDIRELFSTLWRGKWVIVAFTLLFSAAGIGYAMFSPNIYQSSVLVAPAQEEGGGLGGLASQFGGLASLAGINLGGGSANQTAIAKEVLKSRAFLADFFRRHNMAVPLIAAEAWDEKSGELVYDQNKYDPGRGEWLIDSDGETHEPTDWDMVEAFREDHFTVSEAKDAGMITIRVKHYSPVLAKQWAEKLVHDINEHMRKQDVEEAEARIAYLEDKLSETNIAGMQQVFYQLIENETRTVMLANAQSEYIFKTVDPAVVPEDEAEPKRVLIIMVSTVLGGMLGVFVVFVSAFLRSDKYRTEEKTVVS